MVRKHVDYPTTFKLPRERDIFCLLNECKVCGRKVQINPGTTSTDPVEMLEETGAQVLKSTQHKGHSAWKKPFQAGKINKSDQTFATPCKKDKKVPRNDPRFKERKSKPFNACLTRTRLPEPNFFFSHWCFFFFF